MKTIKMSKGFLITETRIMTKAISTALLENAVLKKQAVQDVAYALDPSLVDDPVYGREVHGGRNRLGARFDRWKYRGSEKETYRHLPAHGPDFIKQRADSIEVIVASGKKVDPLTEADCAVLMAACSEPRRETQSNDAA